MVLLSFRSSQNTVILLLLFFQWHVWSKLCCHKANFYIFVLNCLYIFTPYFKALTWSLMVMSIAVSILVFIHVCNVQSFVSPEQGRTSLRHVSHQSPAVSSLCRYDSAVDWVWFLQFLPHSYAAFWFTHPSLAASETFSLRCGHHLLWHPGCPTGRITKTPVPVLCSVYLLELD